MSRHLLDIAQLERRTLDYLLDRGEYWLDPAHAEVGRTRLIGRGVALLFYENSTRTRCSFELAARRLGADVLNLDIEHSAVEKGESIVDTGTTLAAMGISHFVIRHGSEGVPAELASALPSGSSVLNAGEAHVAHPTQALLDALTLRRSFGQLEGLRIAIIGDIRHSRVAASAISIFRRLGVGEIRLAGPRPLLPDNTPEGTQMSDRRDEALAEVDVVMALRIQRERMARTTTPDPEDYREHWGLEEADLARLAPEARLMHPGPVNRGVEISDELADGPRSLIREQVRNGVAMRMAVLEWLDEENRNGQ